MDTDEEQVLGRNGGVEVYASNTCVSMLSCGSGLEEMSVATASRSFDR